MVRRQIRFIGRVQGVGFRATTLSIARQYAVSGWVRNEDDGSVLLEVQGAAPVVQQFLTQVEQALARFIVSRSGNDLPAISGDSGFGIRR